MLSAYVRQLKDEIDASVELYLLNFWIKDHSIRDLSDRIQQVSTDVASFAVLLDWFKPAILDV